MVPIFYMIQSVAKLHLILLIAIVVSSIGVLGQTYLLHHEIVDCLPYKVLNPELYQTIANIGVWIAPTIAVISGWLFGLKRLWLAPVIPVVLCPLLFAGIYKIISVVSGSANAADQVANFDSLTQIPAAQRFFSYSVSLAIAGLVIGLICSLLLMFISKSRSLS